MLNSDSPSAILRQIYHVFNIHAERGIALKSALNSEEEIQKEIEYYNSLPCVFEGFITLPPLSDRELSLVCVEKQDAVPEKKYVPGYLFQVYRGNESIGDVHLRIGYTDGLYYGGQVGYNIDEAHRGNGYAGRACRLLVPVAKAHGMQKLLITNSHTNTASMRVCEKLGAKLLRTAPLPQWHELYQKGQRFENIYEWDI